MDTLGALRRWFQGPSGQLKSASGLLALLLAFVAVHEWLSSRPRPRLLSWTVAGPGPTPMIDGARPEPLRVSFTGSAAKLEDIGREIKKGVTLEPHARGAWSWATEDQLIFTPAEDWPAGKEYVVRFERGFFPAHLRLDTSARGARTTPFSAALASSEFHVDPRDPSLKQVTATFRFSHPVDVDAFEKRLTMILTAPKKSLFDRDHVESKFTVAYDKFRSEAYVVSQPLAVPLEAAMMEVKAVAGVTPARGGPPTAGALTASVRVPSMFDYFRIEGARAEQVRNARLEPEQVLVIEASGGVSEKALAAGIKAWVLPPFRPSAPGRSTQPNVYWSNAAEVGPQTLAAAAAVTLTPVAAERENPSMHTFKLRVPPGAPVYVRLGRGLKAYGGYVLAKEFDAIVRFPEHPREIKILHEGALLRLSGEKKLSLYSLGEGAVRLEAGRVRPSALNDLASQTDGDFANPRFKGWSFGQDNITERFESVREFGRVEPDRLHFFAFDFTPHLQAPGSGTRNGLFFLRAEGWDPLRKQATGPADTRFILITDLGVLVKENADKTRDVFVQSLAGGDPVAGASVSALGVNGLPIASAETDASGRARLPDLTGFKRERQPAALVVRSGEDVSFMPFDRQDRRLDVSRFDVGGETTEGRERELSAYLFSDRGLYRPGETFHTGIIVRPTVWGQDLTGVPLEVSVLDPRGLEVKKLKLPLSASGFESIDYATQENGPTGVFQVCVYILKDGRRGALLGSTSVRVEEFLPDRLRITARFSEERTEGWVSPKGLKAEISLHNLFGTPAEGRRVSGRIRLSPAAPTFKEFAEYSFFDPSAAKKSFTESLDDAATGPDGAASFALPLEGFAGATYRLELTAEGFEAEGGRGVAAQASVLVSPRPYLLGLKPDGELRYVARGSTRTVSAAAVGPEGRPVGVSSITAQLLEERWISALVKGHDGLYRYQSVAKELFVSSRTLSLPAAPRPLKLDTSSPGDYALVLRDESGTELNRLRYSVAGHGNLTRSLEKNAELQVRLERTDYAPGERVEMQIKAPYAGAGLISIERDKVYAHKWFQTSVSASTQSIVLPGAVEGNAYVSVTFLRAPDSREVFMSPLSHGVAAFSVSRSRRELPVTLEAPEAMKPGRIAVLRVKTPRRARVAVFAADEGILQAAGWTAPDPLAHFLRKRALEVRTFQILDLLLPEHRLSMSVMAPGGDKDGWDAAGKNLNPFKRKRDKPAVFWSGILETGPEGKEISFMVPDSFNGTLRVTAVAVEPNSIGVVQKKILIRQAIVLSPNAPLFAAPGDEFEASVAVANGVKGSGPAAVARVTLKTSGHLELIGESLKTLPVSENRESVAVFRLKARPALGAAGLTFDVSIGSETSRREASLSVRPSMPYQVTLVTGHLKRGREESAVPRRMYPAYRTLEAAVSPVPLVLAKGLLQYLQKYPYGCTEQVLSQTFPALILRRRPEFGYAPETVEANLAQAVAILRSRQNQDGAFGMWASNSHVSPFQAVYAAHFLTEAADKGYSAPPELLSRALTYLNALAAGGPEVDAPPRVRAYAIYVLTRNGRTTTPLINGLRARLERDGDRTWRSDLTAAYLASSYALLHLDAQARDLMNGVATGEPRTADWEYFYDDAVHEAQYLYLLSLHFPVKLAALDADAVLRVVAPLQRGSYNSLSAAYSILALDAYASAAGELKPGEARLEEVLEAGGRAPLVLPPGLFSKAEFTPAAKAIAIENLSARRLFYQTTQSGFDLAPPKEAVRRKLEVFREILDEKNKPVAAAELGRDYTVRVRVRSLDGTHVPNLAVVDLVPGGFEPVWKVEAEEPSGVDYRDVREDRVLFFGSAGGSVLELTYRIKASSRGRFAVPPPFAESMYDRSVSALGTASVIEVK